MSIGPRPGLPPELTIGPSAGLPPCRSVPSARCSTVATRRAVRAIGRTLPVSAIDRRRVAPYGSDDKRHTPGYPALVKTYAWSTEKNDLLQQQRGVSFEDVVLNIQLGNEIDVFAHPNQERHPGQKISVVLIEGYVYLVPFVETEDEIFLKAIIPSRKATKHYGGGADDQA
jgi:hypothetical protein